MSIKEFVYSKGFCTMEGEYHKKILKKASNGDWVIECMDRDSIMEPMLISTFAVDEDKASHFIEFLEINDFYSLSAREKSDIFVTDYSPWKISIFFEDKDLKQFAGANVNIEEYREYTDMDYALLKRVDEEFEGLRGKILEIKSED